MRVIVDQEKFLHTEEDPRYRGAAIPSKAFKMLQHMTDGGQPDLNGVYLMIFFFFLYKNYFFF